MQADRSEQPRAVPDAVPEDPETPDDRTAVFLVPLDDDVDVAAAEELLRALPGVTGVSVDRNDRTIMVWGSPAILSEQELAAAMAHASGDRPDSAGE